MVLKYFFFQWSLGQVSHNLLIRILKCKGLLLVVQLKIEISPDEKSGVESCFPIQEDLHPRSESQRALYRGPLTYPPPSSKEGCESTDFSYMPLTGERHPSQPPLSSCFQSNDSH